MSFSKGLLNSFDAAAANVHLRMAGEQPGLSIFLFHSIFKDKAALGKGFVYPQERMTVDLFRHFLDYFLSKNYCFITPDEATCTSLDAHRKYALITLDDGYFNNTLLLDTLAEYRVPALFFIATQYVEEGIRFWSDALYCERHKRGVSGAAILQELMVLKRLRVKEIFSYLKREFGPDALVPQSDIDRPLTPAELREFAQHPFVHIGNHTHSHELLTNLSPEEIREELRQSQQSLESLTGRASRWISYPNGSYNNEVLSIVKEEGFSAGITTKQLKNKLPLDSNLRLELSRFNPVADERGTLPLQKFRSSLQLKTWLKARLQ